MGVIFITVSRVSEPWHSYLYFLYFFFFTSYMQTVLAGSRSGNSSSTAQSFLLERKKERPIRHQYVLGSDEL